ncbi:hypothetical protein GGI02_002730 [Coemansia sp. RSA 2322]|nr:hypothetical protein GGI02_002730 [Coemansia sp. RSA 2322]
MARKPRLAKSSRGEPPATPVATRAAEEQSLLATPPNCTAVPVPACLLSSNSIRRVHFSPSNEEIHAQTAPHSSPTRAMLRPYSRSILKRTSALMEDAEHSQLSSDADYSAPSQHPPSSSNGQGRLEPAARVLFANSSILPQESAINEPPQTFEEAFPAAVGRLHELVLENGQANALCAVIYNELCGLAAKFPHKLGEHLEDTIRLLGCIERDLADDRAMRQVVLVAVKCLGCVLHISTVCAAVPVDRLGAVLAAMQQRVSAQFIGDKAVCQAGVWCISMLRAPTTSYQSLIPNLLRLCGRAMAAFAASTSVQFECLSAVESLLRRAPAVTREVFHLWLLPVFMCVVSPVPSVRTKADSIIRHNIPWIAADMHGPAMDTQALQFLETRFDQFLDLSCRLIDRGEPVLLLRVWGMYVVIFAKHCRTRLNDMLKGVQLCFNSTDPQVLVAALMQWRCLIYAFHHSKQLQRKKCIELILTPIISLLKAPQQSVPVRLACVRCWATLVYALGDEAGSNIDVITGVPRLLDGECNMAVRDVVARVLAALLNRFVLSDDAVPQFMIPQMIIGTTTLAASDGKSLSTTHGPFSSESEFDGDHTAIICCYVVGLSTTSPTLPVILDAMCEFVKGYLVAKLEPPASEMDMQSLDNKDSGLFKVFEELCNAVALAQAKLLAGSEAETRDKAGACCCADRRFPEVTLGLFNVYLGTSPPVDPQSWPNAINGAELHDAVLLPRLILSRVITSRLGNVLSSYCGPEDSKSELSLEAKEWVPRADKLPKGLPETHQTAGPCVPVEDLCRNATFSVYRGGDLSRVDPLQRPDALKLPTPTYLGKVRAYEFIDTLRCRGFVADKKDNEWRQREMPLEDRPFRRHVSEPPSSAASLHDLGDCAAIICALSSVMRLWARETAVLRCSQVEYIMDALLWIQSWVPLFEDEQVRHGLWMVETQVRVMLFCLTRGSQRHLVHQAMGASQPACGSGNFWRSCFMVLYDRLVSHPVDTTRVYSVLVCYDCDPAPCSESDMNGVVFCYLTMHLLLVNAMKCATSYKWTYSLSHLTAELCLRHSDDLCFPLDWGSHQLLESMLEYVTLAGKLRVRCLVDLDSAIRRLVEMQASITKHFAGVGHDLPFEDYLSDVLMGTASENTCSFYLTECQKSNGPSATALKLLLVVMSKLKRKEASNDSDKDLNPDLGAQAGSAVSASIAGAAHDSPSNALIETDRASAAEQSNVMQPETAIGLSEPAARPNGSALRGRKRKRAKLQGAAAATHSGSEGSCETSPEPPGKKSRPASTPLARLRQLLEEMNGILDSDAASSLELRDICDVQTALADMQHKTCRALRKLI